MSSHHRILSRFASVLAVGVLCGVCAEGRADMLPPYITGTCTATEITDAGPYNGWYLYEIAVEWDLGDSKGCGLSHWDAILKTGCAADDHLIEFDCPAGYSTSEDHPGDPGALGWTGYFIRTGDPSLSGSMTDPVVKYDEPLTPDDEEPGCAGHGTFYFYANILPEYGTYAGALVAKAGQVEDTYGTLTGAYPSCTIVPEPATIGLTAFGAMVVLLRRRRR